MQPQRPDLEIPRRPRQVESVANRPQHRVQEAEVRLVLLLLPRKGIGDLRHAGQDGARSGSS